MSARAHLNGRRGTFLALFALIYVAIGLSYVFVEPGAPVQRAMEWLPWWCDLTVCGALWVAAGVTALAAAFRPIPRDKFGFQALAAISAGWAFANVVSWAGEHASRGWVAGLIFAAFAAAILVVAGMTNPVLPLRRRT